MMIRVCPSCNREITYKHPISYSKAKKENKNCVKCTRKEVSNRPEVRKKNSDNLKISMKGKGNNFYGRKHTQETKDKIAQKISVIVTGRPNKMKGQTYHTYVEKQYGRQIANEKSKARHDKLSVAMSGSNNPMYGKPSPSGSGNGWSGWYKGWFFRSLIELSYMVKVIERFGIDWVTGETSNWKIPYTSHEGNKRTYFPDFILVNKYIIECKPKNLHKSINVIMKTKAAEKFCTERGMVYKLIDCKKLSTTEISNLRDGGDIKFTDRYEKKYVEYYKQKSK